MEAADNATLRTQLEAARQEAADCKRQAAELKEQLVEVQDCDISDPLSQP